ncbi:MAG: VWA domain-containing protein [Crocinitomicaceae bacterium]
MTSQYQYKIKSILIATIVFELIFWATLTGIYFTLDGNEQFFRVENKNWWYLLLFIPILLVGFFLALRWKNTTINKLSDTKLLQYLIPPISSTRVFLKFILFKTAITFFIIALLNPQFGTGTTKGKSEGVEIAIALDISNSMRALDLDNKRSRLKIAKMSIERLMKSLHGDRVALIIFAGEAFVQVPLTDDYGSLKSFLNSIDPDMLSNQGTNISDAIETSLSAFDLENNFSKTIIIISDGEDHEGAAIDRSMEAFEKQVIINTVGMGTTSGTVIPNIINGKRAGLKKDSKGKTVTTKVNSKMLTSIARKGGGEYVQAQGSFVDLQPLINNINSLEKTEFESKSFTDYQDQFQWFIAIGLLFILLYFVLPNKQFNKNEPQLNENE